MIGIILKDLRAEKGVTQIQLAEKLSVKQSTISSWEIERTSPTLEQLGDLASIFDVTCDYLIGRTKEYQGDIELSAPYKRRLKMQQAAYSFEQCIELLREFIRPDNINKDKLFDMFEHMSDKDFKCFANIVAAFIASKTDES